MLLQNIDLWNYELDLHVHYKVSKRMGLVLAYPLWSAIVTLVDLQFM